MFQKFVLFLYGIPQLKLQQKQLYLLPELNMTGLLVKKNPKASVNSQHGFGMYFK